MSNKKAIRSLYISYNAITEPIVQSQVLPYLRELSKKGIEFCLLTYEKKRGEREKFSIPPAIKHYKLRYHKKPTIPATIFDVFSGIIYSIYIILKNRIDVVHARAIVAALAGFPAARLLGKKFIFDTRGIDSEEYVDAGAWKRGGAKYKVVGSLEKFLIKHSDHVVVLTEKFLEVLKKKFMGRNISFSVIPCAVDTDKFSFKNRDTQGFNKLGIENKFIVVYIGSLGTWYMFEEMIDFFKVVDKLIENAHFLLLTQTDQVYARDILNKKGIDGKQVTLAHAPYDEMPECLSMCKLGIFFIRPVFSKLSSSPVKFAEYLSSGLPVVINSGIGDTAEIVKHYRLGAVIDKFDEESYAKAINSVTDMLNTEKDALRSRCREAAEKELSLKAAIEKYYAIYKSISNIKMQK